jgi:hypothetical protein
MQRCLAGWFVLLEIRTRHRYDQWRYIADTPVLLRHILFAVSSGGELADSKPQAFSSILPQPRISHHLTLYDLSRHKSGVELQKRDRRIGKRGHTLQVVQPVRTLGLLARFLLVVGGGGMLGKEGVACASWPEG